MKKFTSVFTGNNKGFTLFETLLVFFLLSLVFGTVLTLFHTAGQGALTRRQEAEYLNHQAFLSYRLRHQIEGFLRSFRMEKREDGLYMGFITSFGEIYRGVVQVRYRYQGNELFYCEKPYPYGEILSCEENKEVSLGTLKDFRIKVFRDDRWWSQAEGFSGRPEKVEIQWDNNRMIIPVRVGQVLQ